MGQLADAKARLAHASTEEEQSRMKLGMSEKELITLEGKWKAVEREAGDSKELLDAMKGDVEKFRRKVAECGWSADKEKEGETALRAAKGQVRQLTEVSSLFLPLLTKANLLRIGT
jgi:structural maintenance of chromosome 2